MALGSWFEDPGNALCSYVYMLPNGVHYNVIGNIKGFVNSSVNIYSLPKLGT